MKTPLAFSARLSALVPLCWFRYRNQQRGTKADSLAEKARGVFISSLCLTYKAPVCLSESGILEVDIITLPSAPDSSERFPVFSDIHKVLNRRDNHVERISVFVGGVSWRSSRVG